MSNIAIIDADSMIYEIACVSKNPKKNERTLVSKIEHAIETCEADTGFVFIKGSDNFRYVVDPEYKAGRKNNKLTEVQREMLEALYEYAGTFCTKSDGAEADDWCGIAGRNATENGDSFILSHIDKDLNTLVGRHHNFKKGVIYDTSKEESTRFLMQQLITGDSADSIFGIYGMGPVKAKRLLDAHGPESLWATVVGTWQYNHEADWKEKLTKCANLIYIRDREADLRNLTFEELEDRIAWKTT